MKQYKYYMYQKSVLQWEECALTNADGEILDEDFDRNELLAAFDKANSIFSMVMTFFGLIQANIYL